MTDNRILRLDERTASKIAAGEVVERPAMVVKELVENAIDAGAFEISVEIQKGGKGSIRVTDNGSGIHYEDLELVFERHATSKIRSIEDLYRANTLGFRGEALASICAVSNVELITMRAGEKFGKRVIAAGGKIQKIAEIGTIRGTTISVKDLFFNTPARLKFLKSDSVEGRSITELMGYLALSHPEVSIKYTSDDKLIFHTQGKGSLQNAIFSVFDSGMVKGLYEVTDELQTLKLKGYVSKFDYSKGTKGYQLTFINGRYVKSELIKEAIQMAYRPYMMNNRYPVCILFLEIPPQEIDVNIHPAKTEIKFHEDNLVKQFIYSALKKAFNLYDQIPKVSFTEKEVFSLNTAVKAQEKTVFLEQEPILERFKSTPEKEHSSLEKEHSSLEKEHSSLASERVFKNDTTLEPANINHPIDTVRGDTATTTVVKMDTVTPYGDKRQDTAKNNTAKVHYAVPDLGRIDLSQVDFSPLTEFAGAVLEEMKPLEGTIYDQLTYIGVFNRTYLLYEKGKDLYLIDQHAAHEKVLFESFMAAYDQQDIQSQLLLIPEIVELSPHEMSYYSLCAPILDKMGFAVEIFGDNSIVIREIPSMLSLSTSKEMVAALFDEANDQIQDGIHHKIAEKACKAAIKAHDVLDHLEQQALIQQLKGLKSPYTCPHGRPIIINFSLQEIEKKFKRI